MSGPAQGTMSSQNQSGQPSPPGRSPEEARTLWEREHEARRADMGRLLQNIKARLPELEALLRQQDCRGWEDRTLECRMKNAECRTGEAWVRVA